MDALESTQCKVLVFESNDSHGLIIKNFCESNNLIPLRARPENLFDVLKSNVDLGAIFLTCERAEGGMSGTEVCKKVHQLRPELPIFFKKNSLQNESGSDELELLGVQYDINDIDSLKPAIDDNIFNKHYPNELLRGISEITLDSLTHVFKNVDVDYSSPYLVKDRIIYGELFSMIAMESSWCRGYMMLQSDQKDVMDLVNWPEINADKEYDFREVNDVLSEITNMIWGGIKSRFISNDDQEAKYAAQVPIIVNHENKYISFGSDIPQLCFKFQLKNRDLPDKDIVMYCKFVFSLNWDPDKFTEHLPSVEDFVDSGELEFF